MRDPLVIEIVGGIFALTGVLVSTLLGVIIHEMRQLREELHHYVPQSICELRMDSCGGRIRRIEKILEHLNQ